VKYKNNSLMSLLPASSFLIKKYYAMDQFIFAQAFIGEHFVLQDRFNWYDLVFIKEEIQYEMNFSIALHKQNLLDVVYLV